MPRVSGERYNIPNVVYSCGKLHESFKAHSKSCMRNRSISPQIQVPPQLFGIQPAFLHASLQHLQTTVKLLRYSGSCMTLHPSCNFLTTPASTCAQIPAQPLLYLCRLMAMHAEYTTSLDQQWHNVAAPASQNSSRAS